jgi:hypothetical protein
MSFLLRVFYSPDSSLISKYSIRKIVSALVFRHRHKYVLSYSAIIYNSRLIMVRIYI